MIASIDEAVCVGCGACVAHCPLAAQRHTGQGKAGNA